MGFGTGLMGLPRGNLIADDLPARSTTQPRAQVRHHRILQKLPEVSTYSFIPMNFISLTELKKSNFYRIPLDLRYPAPMARRFTSEHANKKKKSKP